MTGSGPLGLPPELLDVLACPCPAHGALDVDGGQLVCTVCGHRFDVRDGVPVMLIDGE